MAFELQKREPRERLRSVAILLALLALAAPALWSVAGIRLHNDIRSWLPAEDPQSRVLAWYDRHFPAEDRILVSWTGSSLDDPRVARFAESLNRSPLIAVALTPHDLLDRMTAQGVAAGEAERRLQGVLLGRDRMAAVSVAFSDAGRADKQAAFTTIRRAAREVGVRDEEFHIGGRPVAGFQLDEEVRHIAWNPDAPLTRPDKKSILLLCAAAGAVLALVMLRSVRLAVSVIVVTFLGVLLAVAAVPLLGGSMNMVLVVMPILLMVLTLSAAIHVANYWKHAAADNPRTAIRQTVRTALVPCCLAGGTTAIGLASLATSPLAPVRDFGVYSALGCAVTLAVVLLGLPALLAVWPGRRPTRRETEHAGWRHWANRLMARRRTVLVAGLTIAAVSTLGLTRFRTETDVIHYFPDDSRIVQDHRRLEDDLAGIVPLELVVRFNEQAQQDLNFLERMELVRGVQRQVREHPEVSGTLSLADFQPVAVPPGADATYGDRARYGIRARRTEMRIKEDYAREAAAFLTVVEEWDRIGDGRETEAGDELWRITAQVAMMSDFDYADLTTDLDAIAVSSFGEREGVDHVVTGMVPLFLRTQQAVLQGLIQSFLIAFVIIAAVMALVLRSPTAGLITMVPNLLPVGVVFGLISWAGVPVDLGTMITASVGLGIAVDGTLHLLTWFKNGIALGMTRREAIARALSHCGPAIWQTSAAVGLGLLVLLPADLLLISRFGWLMALLVATAMAGDLILLPALLAGPLGTIIERTTARPQPAPAFPATVVPQLAMADVAAEGALLSSGLQAE